MVAKLGKQQKFNLRKAASLYKKSEQRSDDDHESSAHDMIDNKRKKK